MDKRDRNSADSSRIDAENLRRDEAELEELEERHRAGYRKHPPSKEEFWIPEEDHAWGEGPWKDE